MTTKNNGNDIDVFRVGFFGLLSPSPVVNSKPGALPFAVTFDPAGNLVVADTGIGSLVTYSLNRNGTLTQIARSSEHASGHVLGCPCRGVLLHLQCRQCDGQRLPRKRHRSAHSPRADFHRPGTVDASASANGQFLYVQTGGNGIVDEFQVGVNGTLTAIGSVSVAGAAGGEGIVAF